MKDTHYTALHVKETTEGQFSRQITQLAIADLPDHDTLIRVHYAALNYKDALSATGNKGVTRHYPHTPGIDAAGEIVKSGDPSLTPGAPVIVTSYDLGMNTAGGFGQYIQVPADWVVPLPKDMTLEESMIIGTAGFTAGLALYKMEKIGQQPDMGPIVITGASGGVGSLATGIFSRAGYEVHASTGKTEAHDFLKALGATEVVGREYVQDPKNRPLLRPKWAGALDTVGGETLATLLKACSQEGSVATCGLVGSPKLQATVFPFILNGVNLLGVESATTARKTRMAIWEKLAGEWKLPDLTTIATQTNLTELNDVYIDKILQGQTKGRIILKHDM